MRVEAVLFDMDGVLVHSKPVWRALIQRLAAELGYTPPSDARFEQMWGQSVQADVDTLFTEQSVDELCDLYAARFLDHADALVVDPEGPEVFRALRTRGRPIAVVTNTPRDLAEVLLDRAGLLPDTLVGGTCTPRGKPAPDPLLEACRRLGYAPTEVLMVGDTDSDRSAAAAAGTPFAGFGGIDGQWRLERLGQVLEVLGP